MDQEADRDGTDLPPVSPAALRALAALLSLDADQVAGVLARAPSRRRPARQYGPELDLGGPAG